MRRSALLVVLAIPLTAWALPAGISGYSGRGGSSVCTACHGVGATPPTVAIVGPATLTGGQSGAYTLTVKGGPAMNAGMNVALGGANSGAAVLAAGAGTRVLNAEVVHNGAQLFAAGTASFTFSVKAPLTSGVFTLFGAGLSSNNNGSTSGDGVGTAALDVTVQAVAVGQPDAGSGHAPPGDAGSPLIPDAGPPPAAPTDAGAGSVAPGAPPAPPAGDDAAASAEPLSDGLVEGDGGCSSTGGLPMLGMLAALASVRVRRPKNCRATGLCQPEWTMTTRRTTLRRSFRLPLSLGRRLPALTADVSRGGFCAELPQVFLPGSKVDGYFLIGNDEVPFRGCVTWAVPGNPMASVFSQIGVRFDAMPEGLKELFHQLEKRPRKLKKK